MLGSRNYPLLIGAGVAVLLSSLVGAAALTGALPSDAGPSAIGESTARAAAAKNTRCRTCGVITSTKTVTEATNRKLYRITVRMDDGSVRTLSRATEPAFAVGARVRVNGNALERA